ncbi:Urc2p Ecym_1032 [Eremothecium cymbalariae DBVPG|uniref:Zn(2)-C6 fungal-type domain-containing protein n=1 Tax=Eremothecium cymbalariae (strain CBS 270.75 / DBVPG 7215 / KCTC 17166 / NRRL Y-17582) TaxID=931890 RepID=G8JM30_ERECY|nr:hypothetical protein Ecym_1032 [Eremothecium cymbalariae DBVPG\
MSEDRVYTGTADERSDIKATSFPTKEGRVDMVNITEAVECSRIQQSSVMQKRLPSEIETADDLRDTNSYTEGRNVSWIRKQRKKRKTYSCGVCRKFKTRCDFEAIVGKCHRCNVLNLECSLTKEREDDILTAIELASGSQRGGRPTVSKEDRSKILTEPLTKNPVTPILNKRLNTLESNIGKLSEKLDFILGLLKGSCPTVSSGNASTTVTLFPDKVGYSSVEERKDGDDGDISDNTNYAKHNYDDEYSKVGYNKLLNDFQNKDSPTKRVNDPSPSCSNIFSKGFLDGFKLKEPPFKLLSDLDTTLFPTKALSDEEKLAKKQRPFLIARTNFMNYFNEHEQLCLRLSREFLVKSHFWIIPGGIKEIDRTYVEQHVFITGVFTIVAMGFAENDKYEKEQGMLYPIVESLLTSTLTLADKLTDHDIEAILYCCMFNISRKSKRHRQLKFNSLILCNFAIDALLTNIDFYKIKDRVLNKEEYNATDLYHLRILNSLTACKLQYSIGYGAFRLQNETTKEFNNLIAKFPQANFGDDIKVSVINLAETLGAIFLNFKEYFKTFSKEFKKSNSLNSKSYTNISNETPKLVFAELEYWLVDWDELLSKDGAGILLFSYHFYYIMICRAFLIEFYENFRNDMPYYKCILSTMKHSCFSLLNGFLKLPPALIKGAPVITLHQLVYVCLTMYDFLSYYQLSERQQILNICTKIYWHLNTIGEKTNEATEHVGKIIKSLIDTSRNNRKATFQLPTPVIQNGDQATQPKLQPPSNNGKSSEGCVTHHTTPNSSINNDMESNSNFIMPDVDKFNTFEDFFQDFFEHLKPTTKNMFPTVKKI